MRQIDADALLKEFKARAVSARNWKERAIMEKNEEAIIRADATLAFLSEVKLTIDNAPTVDTYTEDDVQYAIREGHQVGYEMAKAKFERPTGEWKDHRWCSNCGCGIPTDVYGTSITEEEAHFCVECGARMEAENGSTKERL